MLAAFLGGCRARVAHSHNTTCNHLRQDRRLRPLFYRSYTAAAACGRDAGKWLFGNRPFTVLPNAVDLARFRFDPERRARTREALGVGAGELLVGHVGRFNGQKKPRLSAGGLRAPARSAAGGAAAAGRRRLSGGANARPGRAAGAIACSSPASVPDPETYLCAMDVMALPSLFEGFPTVLLEWQCAGLPTLVSDRVTREAALTPLVRYMPLEAGADAWAQALAALPEAERARSSQTGADALRAGGYALEDAAQALLALLSKNCHPPARLGVAPPLLFPAGKGAPPARHEARCRFCSPLAKALPRRGRRYAAFVRRRQRRSPGAA